MKEQLKFNLRTNGRWYFKKMSEHSPIYFVLVFLGTIGMAIQSGLTIALPTILVSQLQKGTSFSVLLSSIIGIGSGLAVVQLANNWLTLRINLLCLDLRQVLHVELIKKSLTMDYQQLENPEIRLLQKIAGDNALSNNHSGGESFARYTFLLIQGFVSLALFSLTLSFFSPLLLVLIGATILVSFFALRRSRDYRETHKEAWGKTDAKRNYLKRNAYAIENGKDIRMYQMTDWYDEHIEAANQSRLKAHQKESTQVFLMTTIQDTSLLIRNAIAFFFLVSGIINKKISLIEFTLFFSVLVTITQHVNQLSENSHRLLQANQDLNDLRRFLELPEERLHLTKTNEKEFAYLRKQKHLTIRFDHVSFRYPKAEVDTLKDLTFELIGGQKIALVGHNGAGKTTIVKLLSGLLKPTSGTIYINEIDSAKIPLELYYELVAPVFQESLVFAFDVAVNVTMTSQYNSDKLLSQLDKADILTKVTSLKNGFKTQLKQYLKPDGIQFSGGETQKLMIARALYKDAHLLILDEPTAALDAIAESDLYEKYEVLTKDKTALFISHRLASTRFCETILFLEQGVIIEKGSHQQLLAKAGKYAEMYQVQSHYYQKEVNLDGAN